jgi:hypothetical protein
MIADEERATLSTATAVLLHVQAATGSSTSASLAASRRRKRYYNQGTNVCKEIELQRFSR